MIRFRCPKCHAVLKIRDSVAGRKGSCPQCGQRLQLPVPPPGEAVPSGPVPAPVSTPHDEPLPVAGRQPLSFLPRIPRRSLLIAGLALGLLLVLGLFWFAFSRDTPSKVLVSAIMKANGGHYSAADESLLPETLTAIKSRIMTQLMWDNITKKGTVQNVKVLNEEVRGEGATVRISVEYRDGTSSQVEEMMSKVQGKWKVSLMGLMQTSVSATLSAGQNSSRSVSPDPQDPLGLGRSRQVPVASNQKRGIENPVGLKVSAPEPAPNPRADNYKPAMGKLGEFQSAGDDKTRSRIAKELAEMSGKWTKDESSQVVEAVAKLGTSGKPLARLLCEMIANGPLTPQSIQADPVRRQALAALESVHPDLYQPVIGITIDHWTARTRAAKKLAELTDGSVAPILLKRLKEAAGGPWFWDVRETLIAYMEALIKISPDEPSTYQAIFAIARTRATDKNAQRWDSGVAVAAVQLLGRFGPRAKDAVPILRQLKLDENAKMRQAASDALKQIERST
jgi:hypothetical protein